MPDHTRAEKDKNLAKLRREQPGIVAKADAARAAPASTRDILSSRGDTIDAAVADTQRLKSNQSTDSNN